MSRALVARPPLCVSFVVGAMLATACIAGPAAAQSCQPMKTGLVLSGGGAKGFAHIGVFKVLDSLNIRPDFIVGTSIGAIGGALYASGYSGHAIDSVLRTLPITNVIRSYSPVAPGVIGQLPTFAMWENNGQGFMLQTGAVREGEVNALMSALMLRGNLLAQGDFDRLPIPLRVVATRLSTRKPVVLATGDLAQAVRASFAIPLLFTPGVIGDDILMDGGVSDNIPVDIARAMGAERLIVSTLPTATVSDELLGDPIKVALQLADFLFRNDTTGYRPQDLIIRNRTTDASPLDFSPAAMDSLVQSGMEVAREVFARAGCVRTLRDEADNAHADRRSMPTRLTDLTIENPKRLESQTLRFALGLRVGTPLVEDSLRSRLLQLGQSDDYKALWLNPTGTDSTLQLRVAPVYGARQSIIVGLAYDNDLGGRLWGAMAWRDLFASAVEGSVTLDVGKYRQEYRAGLRRRIPAFQRAAPLLTEIRSVTEDIRIFTDNSTELNPITTRDMSIAAGISGRGPLGLSLSLTPNIRWWRGGAIDGLGALGVTLRLAKGDRIVDRHLSIDGELNTRFQRVQFESKRTWVIPLVDITPRLRVGWSRQAPLQQQFVLGGYDGFAGLQTTERRGEQEAMVGLAASRAVLGPIRGIAEIMTGATGSGPGFLRRDPNTISGQVITGARIGGVIRTDVLTLLVQRGFNSSGGDLWFVRLGQWF